jgi:putative SOS response-associated peptidase YedK
MCGRYRLSRGKQGKADGRGALRICRLARRLESSVQHRANPAIPVMRQNPKEPVRQISTMRWGLVPSWAKDTSGAARMINARSETAATKPAFRDPLRYRRCLIPADAFYEWKKTPPSKQPYCFEVNDGQLFAFAGLWDGWKDGSGNWVKTCSILTMTPNAVTSVVHDRMPVILRKDDYDVTGSFQTIRT